jgi:hypothetical protein
MKKSLLLVALSFAFIARTLACSVGGTVSGTKTLCSGSNSGSLTLSGYTGTINRWESSVSPFTIWTPISHTSNSYTSGALTQTTAFRAVVQNGVCAAVASDSVVIIVVTTPVKGAITAAQNSCAYYNFPDEVLTLSGSTGTVLGWQYAAAPYISWINISSNPWGGYVAITSTTATVPVSLFASPSSSSPGIYAFRAVLACTDTINSDSVKINYKNSSGTISTWLGRSTNWSGYESWCGGGGVPYSSSDASIPGGMQFYPVITSAFDQVQNLTLDSGASLHIAAGGGVEPVGKFNKTCFSISNQCSVGNLSLRVYIFTGHQSQYQLWYSKG